MERQQPGLTPDRIARLAADIGAAAVRLGLPPQRAADLGVEVERLLAEALHATGPTDPDPHRD